GAARSWGRGGHPQMRGSSLYWEGKAGRAAGGKSMVVKARARITDRRLIFLRTRTMMRLGFKMTFAVTVLTALSVLAQQKPPKPAPIADGALVIEMKAQDVLAFSKDGNFLAVMDRISSKVALYDAKTFKEVRV